MSWDRCDSFIQQAACPSSQRGKGMPLISPKKRQKVAMLGKGTDTVLGGEGVELRGNQGRLHCRGVHIPTGP